TVNFIFNYQNKILEQNILGLNFKNPIGLAAGFDKNAELINFWPNLGFGFIEVGSITGMSCLGNPKPRLWRLKKSKGLVVYYGLKNDGAEKIYERIKNVKVSIPVGISVARTNSKETISLQDGINDYLKSLKIFKETGDYFTINISCPNAFGGETFMNPKMLDELLKQVEKINILKPVFLKLAPDVNEQQLDEIINVVLKYKIINGFICTNLTKKRNLNLLEKNIPAVGGISGQPLKSISNQVISHIYKKTKGQYVIIGVGGVSSANDAYEKIKSGASLIQLITGMIFEGPQLINQINFELTKLIKKDGLNSIEEAVGLNFK
ncbi:MAG: quinone-dependent dihydroorotate dehydrogenase, partial [Minisyncoccia bacterium]